MTEEAVMRSLFGGRVSLDELKAGKITEGYRYFYDMQAQIIKQREQVFPRWEERYWIRHQVENMRNIRELAGSQRFDHALDVGCGEGVYTEVLADLAKEVVGIDISERRIRNAHLECKERGLTNVKYKVGNAMELNFANCSFDLILCKDVLEHLPNDEKCMEEIYRVLRKNGTCIVLVPNGYVLPYYFCESLGAQRLARLMVLSDKVHGHIRSYKPQQIRQKLTRKGFHVVCLKGMEMDLTPVSRKLCHFFPPFHSLLLRVGSAIPSVSYWLFAKCVKI